VADQVVVPGGPIGQRRPRHAGPGGRQVLGLDEVREAPVRRHDARGDRLAIQRREPGALGGREVLGHGAHGLPEDRAFRVLQRHLAQLRERLLHHDARLHDAARDALAHGGDRAVRPADEIVGAPQEALVVRHAAERLGPGTRAEQREDDRHAAHLVDGQQSLGEGRARQPQLALAHEKVVGDPRAADEGCRIEGTRPLQEALFGRQHFGLERSARGVLEAVVVTRIAHEGREAGVQRELRLEVLFVELLERGRRGRHGREDRRRCSRRCGRRRIGRRRGRQAGTAAEQSDEAGRRDASPGALRRGEPMSDHRAIVLATMS